MLASIQAPPMPDGCPWSGWTPPNVNWCEAELCAWITNPADTWSNLAFIVFGVLMWWHARRAGGPTLALFGPASIVVGAFSFIYHASYTWVFQFFDFVGMFVFAALVVAVNLRRQGVISQRRLLPTYLGGVILFSAMVPPMFYLGGPIQALVALLILVIIAQEIRLWQRGRERLFLLSLALLTAGGVCSALDVSRAWCDPHNHWLQGHAVWHVLSAASLLALYGFYVGIDVDGRDASDAALWAD